MRLAEAVRDGDRRALARLLTLVEDEDPQGLAALAELYPHSGRAQRLGITGPTGSGKSTLVSRLALYWRQQGESPSRTVAIVAVDPSSPFTGGALLGDRIRMRDLSGDPGTFIRSMASRGALGGLARTTSAVVEALDGAGFDAVLIETVGAGQTEVDIARTAHTTVVVEAPGMGDEVQALKAGILEVADIVVVNKADLPGAEQTVRALRAAMSMAKVPRLPGWETPLLSTVATDGQGIPELAAAIGRHHQHLRDSGEGQRRERERIRRLLEDLLKQALVDRFLASQADERFDRALERVLQRDMAPFQAVRALVEGEPL